MCNVESTEDKEHLEIQCCNVESTEDKGHPEILRQGLVYKISSLPLVSPTLTIQIPYCMGYLKQ